ncbi:MAG: preprotein translocase subunit SecY, partial [Eggerthellaceae bacterium]|nr:preprotein translocase subunit SecY [Eggerthellaceae bacterium]
MLKSLIAAFKVPELRRKILFTLAILVLYRFGAYVPVPGIPYADFANAIAATTTTAASSSFNLLDLLTGGALSHFSVFSLGIMPYITSSIIMQLMQGVVPAIGRWAKEGESGRKKITQVTRYLTLVLGLINAIGYLFLFKSTQYNVVFTDQIPELFTDTIIVFTLVAGTGFIMWMGELITQRGIGNGMSLIIFTNIVSRVPTAIMESIQQNSNDFGMALAITVLIIVVVVVCIPAIIFVERAQRRIPVNYAKRVQGRKMMGGQSTYIPLKVNSAGVIPIIFASCIIYFPAQLAALFNVGWLTTAANAISQGWINWVLTLILIVFFAYFYTTMVYNPEELSDNMRKQGGF